MMQLCLTLFCYLEMAMSEISSISPQDRQNSSGRTTPCEKMWNPFKYHPGKCQRLIPEQSKWIGDIGICLFRYRGEMIAGEFELDSDEADDLEFSWILKETEDIFKYICWVAERHLSLHVPARLVDRFLTRVPEFHPGG